MYRRTHFPVGSAGSGHILNFDRLGKSRKFTIFLQVTGGN